MLELSELIIRQPEGESFHDPLAPAVRRAAEGDAHLRFDIRPDDIDTPRNREWRLEAAFSRAAR